MRNLKFVAAGILVTVGSFMLGAMFDVNLSVARRPLLTKLLGQTNPSPPPNPATSDSQLAQSVLPTTGVEIPVKWGELGAQLIKAGVIDAKKFEDIYAQRGGLSEPEKNLLIANDNGNIKITQQNSAVLLNLLWALGLGNKNAILDTGPMVDKQYGGAGKFASTGGWSLAVGDAMKHYSKHSFISLTPDQQQLVSRVSQNIYRPCCDNSTYFPDCNHGMAMLGLLELMAAQGINEADMYKYALSVNAYWFPDTYVNIAKYMAKQGTSWDKVNPKEVLGQAYSSATGYRKILSQIEPAQLKGGSGCGV